jgi:hypothetical protein
MVSWYSSFLVVSWYSSFLVKVLVEADILSGEVEAGFWYCTAFLVLIFWHCNVGFLFCNTLFVLYCLYSEWCFCGELEPWKIVSELLVNLRCIQFSYKAFVP